MQLAKSLSAAIADGRLIRYFAMGAINFGVHQLVQRLAFTQLDLHPVWANVLAACVASVPAFFIARNWVWKAEGQNMRQEAIAFWIIALVGLAVSSGVVALAKSLTDESWYYNLASFVGYGLVWVVKFFLLDRLFNLGTNKVQAQVTHEIDDCWNIDDEPIEKP